MKSDIRNKLKDFLENIRNEIKQQTYSACFSESEFNETLWLKYADNHRGFVVEYDIWQGKILCGEKEECLKCVNNFIVSLYPMIYTDEKYDATEFSKIYLLIKSLELLNLKDIIVVNEGYSESTFAKTQNTPTYYFVVQDETAGIIVDLGVTPMDNIQAGDSIEGLKGVYNNTRGITTDFLAVSDLIRHSIIVKNSNNEVKGIEVTFAEILADKKLYENRVVTVRGVKKGSVFHSGTDYMPEDAVEGCFVQGTDTIYYTTGANAGDFTFYDYMDITGVVDNKVIGEYYSIWPLSQEHIIDFLNNMYNQYGPSYHQWPYNSAS